MKLKRNEQLKRKKEKKLKRHKRNREDFFLKSYARSHGLFLDLFFSHLTFKSWKLKAFSILLVFSLMSKLIQIKSRYAKATVLMVVDKRIFSKIFVISVYDIQRLLFPLSFTGPQEPGGGHGGMSPLPYFWRLISPISLKGARLCPLHYYFFCPPPSDFQTFLRPCFLGFLCLRTKKEGQAAYFLRALSS